MVRRNGSLALIVIVGLAIMIVYAVSAQQPRMGGQQGGQPPQGRARMTPEEMLQRRIDRAMEALNLSDEESQAVKPLMEGFLKKNTERSNEMQKLIESLQKAVDDKSDDATIGNILKQIKTKREEHRLLDQKEEKALVEVLTVNQEAILTLQGIVNTGGGGGGMMMRFGGGGQGRNQPQDAGGQGGQGRQGRQGRQG